MKSGSRSILLAAVFVLSLAAFASARDKAVEPMQGVPASRESQVTMANNPMIMPNCPASIQLRRWPNARVSNGKRKRSTIGAQNTLTE